MNQDVVRLPNKKSEQLQAKIKALTIELDAVTNRIEAFESVLRAALIDLLIEEQELTVLYKQQKKLKKEKRLEQKKRGKNYIEPTGLVLANSPKSKEENLDQKKERKRLYRKAMMQVHPDRFAIRPDDTEDGTEITAKLIETYQNGDLRALQEIHAYIVSGAGSNIPHQDHIISGDAYLLREIERLEEAIIVAKNKYTYSVLTTYSDPNSFLGELKLYYEDRIAKLRKRTRSKSLLQ